MSDGQVVGDRLDKALRVFTWGRVAWLIIAAMTGAGGGVVGFLLSEGAARARFEDRITSVERAQREAFDSVKYVRDVALDDVRRDAHEEVQQLRRTELKTTNEALNASLVTMGRIEGKLETISDDLREIKAVLLGRKR